MGSGSLDAMGNMAAGIGARQGQYPGMLTARQFTVILPNGTSKVIDYKGKEMPLAF